MIFDEAPYEYERVGMQVKKSTSESSILKHGFMLLSTFPPLFLKNRNRRDPALFKEFHVFLFHRDQIEATLPPHEVTKEKSVHSRAAGAIEKNGVEGGLGPVDDLCDLAFGGR
jgi:hypothetical protein